MSDDAQPVDAFEAALDEFEAIVWRGGVEAHMHKYKRPPEIEDARVRLRAARCPTVTDWALDKALGELRAAIIDQCNVKASETRTGALNDRIPEQTIRALYAAALQQHPRCYKPDSEPECFFEVDRGDKS